MVKGDKFSLSQCPKIDFKVKEMQMIPYASAVGVNVCTDLYASRYCVHCWDARQVLK